MSSRNVICSGTNIELPHDAIISLSNLLQLPRLGSAATNTARSVCLSHDLTVDQYDRFYQNPQRLLQTRMDIAMEAHAEELAMLRAREQTMAQRLTELENENREMRNSKGLAQQLGDVPEEARLNDAQQQQRAPVLGDWDMPIVAIDITTLEEACDYLGVRKDGPESAQELWQIAEDKMQGGWLGSQRALDIILDDRLNLEE